MSEIRVFHSHIEVYPYERGECPQLEKLFSKWVNHSKYNKSGHYEPIAFYIENNILYLPRGANSSMLQEFFHAMPTPVLKCDPYYKITKGAPVVKPKSDIQEDGINFLMGQDRFTYTQWYSQLGLNLPTGDGKTYATVYAIMKLKIRAIIITHLDKLKKEWIKALEMTSFPMENLCDIKSSEMIDQIMKGEISGEIYLINHQTIASYAKVHSWTRIRDFFKKIKVGIRVIDEAHLYFENTLMLDYFSNCYKSYYLTATYGRADASERAVYNRAYQSMARFGEEVKNYESKRKHIILNVVYFSSQPPYGISPNVSTFKGFSAYKYIDYELQEEHHTMHRVLLRLLLHALQYEGKVLVTSPKVESVEELASFMRKETDETVGTIHSKNPKDANENAQNNARIISSTIKSSGTGVDINGLRCIINLEPVGSPSIADQVAGRLREYSDTEDTYLYWPVDLSVPETVNYIKKIIPKMKEKCKEIKYYNLQDM